jgi:mannosyltransferase
MQVGIDGIIYSLQVGGGISVYFSELIRHLLKQSDISVTVDLFEPTKGRGIDDILTLAANTSSRCRPLERYRPCRTAGSIPDVFHSSYYRQPSQKSTPTVVTVYDFIYERFSSGPRRWVHSAQKHSAIRAADAVICISEATRADLEQWVGVRPGQHVHVIPCGVGEVFRPLAKLLDSAPPYVLFVGARGGYKNFTLALKALALLPEFELHCVGGGALRAEELAEVPHSVRARVRHLGHIDDETLNECYNEATCLLYPSSHEGFGIPVIEAMRAGCPVVSIPCKAVLEVGGDALVVAAADAGAIAEAVDSVCGLSRRANVVAAGLNVARSYSWHKTHERTLQVYRSLWAAGAQAST